MKKSGLWFYNPVKLYLHLKNNDNNVIIIRLGDLKMLERNKMKRNYVQLLPLKIPLSQAFFFFFF